MSDFLAEMEARQRRGARTRPPVMPIILALVACLIGSVIVTIFSTDAAEKLVLAGSPAAMTAAYYLRAMIGGLVVGGGVSSLIHFAAVKTTRPKWGVAVIGGLTTLTLAFTVALAALGVADANDRLQQRRAASGMQEVIGGFLKDGLDADMSDTRPRATGDAGEAERALRQGYADILGAARRYNADIDALGLRDLTPQHLARADLSDVLARIERAKLRTAAYREEVTLKIAAFRKRLETSRMSPEAKRQALAGFDAGFDRSRGHIVRVLDLQERLLELMEQQIRFLKRRKGTWGVERGMFAFSSDRDVQTFNATAMEIQAVSGEITRIQAQQRTKMEAFEQDLAAEARN